MDLKEDKVDTNIQPIIVDPEAPLSCIVEQISQNLHESNKKLIYEIMSVLGIDKTLQYYNQTIMVEQQGGMHCKDGSRRKKPGGVFFYLIYHDPSVTENIKRIFSDEARKEYKLKKIEIKERRKKQNLELKERLIKEGLLIISKTPQKND